MPISKQGSCKACGINFTYEARDNSYTRTTCSRTCAGKVGSSAAMKTRVAATATCVVCEATFKSGEKRGNKTTCSRSCTTVLYRKLRPPKVKQCNDCNTDFTTQGRTCEPCRAIRASEVVERARRRKRITKTAAKLEKRHSRQPSGKIVDRDISARVIAELNDYTCYLCGGEVEPHLGKGYQPRGWSVDHILPVTLGGNTEYSNLLCAHVECNSAKGEHVLNAYAFRGLTKAEKYAARLAHEDLFKD